jgi:hypothetical protein
MKPRIARAMVALLSSVLALASFAVAQNSAPAASALPRLVRFGGTVKDLNGAPSSGVVGITFALYSEQTGGSPLWLETQNATADSTGHYTVVLGSTKPEGLPADLFTSEQAHWVGVQVSGQPEQPRVLLVSAPYALKAGDAETIGGLPPSAFVLAAPAIIGSATPGNPTAAVTPLAASSVTTTGGTASYLPIFSGADTIVDSIVFQSATSPFKLGINTANPATMLDVNGAGTIRGPLTLQSTGTATATAGKDSQPLNLIASSFNSTSSTAQGQTFRLQAEPTANDTTAPSATLNLLYGLAATAPSETGLKISSEGLFTFATGQTFPGTGDGSVKSVALAAPATDFTVSESPVTGTGTLNFAWKVPPTNADTANAIVKRDASGNFTAGTITATGLTAGTATLSAGLSIPSTAEFPLNVTSTDTEATSILGQATATTGDAWGVEGSTSSSSGNAYGVYGTAQASTGNPVGVYGSAPYSPSGTGVFGQNGFESDAATAASTLGYGSGVWGDSGSPAGFGVIGSAVNIGGFFVTSAAWGAWTQTTSSSGVAFISGYGSSTGAMSAFCEIGATGSLICTGSKDTVVPIDGGKRIVATSAIESPQNWFEDFGSARLTGGSALIALDSNFTQTVNTGLEYHVFLTPNGDCKGLYVSSRTPASFEVHELGGGSSSVEFSYRIVALRKKYESVRFADHTHDLGGNNGMLVRAAQAPVPTNQQSHTPTKMLSQSRPLIRTTAAK